MSRIYNNLIRSVTATRTDISTKVDASSSVGYRAVPVQYKKHPAHEASVAEGIRFNNNKWKDAHRSEIRQFLHHGPIRDSTGFDPSDIDRIMEIQKDAGLPEEEQDGKIGDQTAVLLRLAGLHLSVVDQKQNKHTELIFLPGELEDAEKWESAKKAAYEAAKLDPENPRGAFDKLVAPGGYGALYVKVNGNIVDIVRARGGPPFVIKDGTHTADPTKEGTYKLGEGKSVKTSNWSTSQIMWDADIRQRPDGEIEFRDPGSAAWVLATGTSCKLRYPLSIEDFKDDAGKIKQKWDLNDFGKRGYKLQNSPGLYLHTSAEDEFKALSGQSSELTHSHGCIHIDPLDRQKLEDNGYLHGGVNLRVRKYTAHLIPEKLRVEYLKSM